MLFIGIIWTPAFKFKNEIIKMIGQTEKVLANFSIDLKHHHDNFILDIYAGEDTPNWKIISKIEHMNKIKLKCIEIVFLDIDTSLTHYHQLKKYTVFTLAENLKNNIREQYNNKIDDYFFDIIFHLTENKEELLHNFKIIKKYTTILSKENGVYDSLNPTINFFNNLLSFSALENQTKKENFEISK